MSTSDCNCVIPYCYTTGLAQIFEKFDHFWNFLFLQCIFNIDQPPVKSKIFLNFLQIFNDFLGIFEHFGTDFFALFPFGYYRAQTTRILFMTGFNPRSRLNYTFFFQKIFKKIFKTMFKTFSKNFQLTWNSDKFMAEIDKIGR